MVMPRLLIIVILILLVAGLSAQEVDFGCLRFNFNAIVSDDFLQGRNLNGTFSFEFNDEDDSDKMHTALEALWTYLEWLPGGFVYYTGIQGIALVDKLFYKGIGQVQGSVSEDMKLLYLSNEYPDEHMMARIFSHELFHVVELQTYRDRYFHPDTWDSFNPPEFRYLGSHEAYISDMDLREGEYPRQGFVTGYAMINAWEDGAETFSYVMTPDLVPKLQMWMDTDPYLRAKVEYLAEKMSNVYYDESMGWHLEKLGF